MEPVVLLRALMLRDEENAHSLAKKLHGKPSQPQIYKFVNGIAKEPRRATLQPLADHYGIPVEAFYDPVLAEKAMTYLRIDAEGRSTAEDPTPAALPSPAVALTPQQQQVLRDLDDMAPSRASKFVQAIHEAAEEAREATAHLARRRDEDQKSLEELERLAARKGSVPGSRKRAA